MLNRRANVQEQIQKEFAQGQFGELQMKKSILNNWSWKVGLKQLISLENQNVGFGW